MDTFTGAAEQAQHLGRTLAGAAEPVRLRGVELDRLPGSQDDVLLAEQQAHPAREDAEPLIAVVRPRVWGRLGGRDDDLPRLDATRGRQREDGAALHPLRLEPDPGVADVRCADQVVQRHPVGLREWQQQLEAGASLPVLQPRERGLGDAGAFGELHEGDRPLGADLPQP